LQKSAHHREPLVVRRSGLELFLEDHARTRLFAYQRSTNLVELGRGSRATDRRSSQVSCRIGLSVLFELGRELNSRGAVLENLQEQLEKCALIGPDRELAALLG